MNSTSLLNFIRPAFLTLSLLVGMLSPQLLLGDEEEKKPPKPEDLILNTKDGVILACTYYGSLKGKQAVPVILLHGGGENEHRGQYAKFALALQDIGHAVMTVDLRGYGGSKQTVFGKEVPDPQKMTPQMLAMMYKQDLLKVKQFLTSKNDKGELNLEALAVVAADMSTVMAINWVIQDWSWPNFPGRRQGKNIKALVLLSPERTYKGVQVTRVLPTAPMAAQSVLIVVGEQSPHELGDANRIFDALRRTHPEPPAGEGKKETLFLVKKKTKLQGMSLLDPRLNLQVDRQIAIFLKWRLVDQQAMQYPWSLRNAANAAN